MIQVVQGPIRSGKSYFAVAYIEDFVTYNALYDDYKIKDGVLIITNIEGFRPRHWTLDKCLKDKSIEEFFSIENFENIQKTTGKNHIILMIDEAHEIFPCDFKSNLVYNFFAFSGHLGIDIFLLTQGIEKLTRIFNPLLEFIVKVTPRSKQVLKLFMYSYTDLRGNYLYSKTLAKKQSVFRMYKSFRVDEKNKPKNAILHWVIVTVVFFVAAGSLFKFALASVAAKSKPKTAAVLPVKTVVPVPAASGMPGQVPGQAIFNNNSSLRVIPVITPVAIWREYQVEAYIRDGGRYHYMIKGNFVDSVRCRNYSSHLKTVEYYSLEPLQDGRAISARQAPASFTGEASSPKPEPLGAGYSPLTWNKTPEPPYVSKSNLSMKPL